jgi:very-short-patch-repair endonuclease
MRRQLAIDQRIAALAGAQGGVVSRAQLVGLGLAPRQIDRRAQAGRLHVLYRAVYAVGHRVVSVEGRWFAAVFAAGDGAVLSHASAAAAWELRRYGGDRIDVTVGYGGRARRDGLRLHRRLPLPAHEVTTRSGIPITTPARTLLDLAAAGLDGRPLEAVLDRAERQRILDFGELNALIERYRGRPGTPSLQAMLSHYTAGTIVTRSELEERFLALCDRFDLPRPNVNTVIEGKKVDFLWQDCALVVEVDGYAWHRSPTAFAEDRERDVELVLAGYRVLRFTWTHVTGRPKYVARAVQRASVAS